MTAKTLGLVSTTVAILMVQVSGVNVSNSACLLFFYMILSLLIFLAVCQDGDVRLSGGQSPSEGQVEICFDNQWGKICDDFWSTSDGNVVCRQLGFSPTGIQIYLHFV